MKRLNIIIVAEGAIDINNKTITTDYIKDVSTELCVWRRAPNLSFPPPPLKPHLSRLTCTAGPVVRLLTVTVFPGALCQGEAVSSPLLFSSRSVQKNTRPFLDAFAP